MDDQIKKALSSYAKNKAMADFLYLLVKIDVKLTVQQIKFYTNPLYTLYGRARSHMEGKK